MNIIVLLGPSSCGKTTILNLVYNLLLLQGGVSTNKQQLGANPNDFSDIVLWKGKKIAFYTMGDFPNPLVMAIRDYFSQNCNTLICACNNRLTPPLEEFTKHNTTRINKNQESNQGLHLTIDNSFANNIFSVLSNGNG